ncbi:MAG TPA: hypothetical protein VIB08_01340 [Thermoanaerobaculia bacterium]|jgi:hypothetical protein
MKRAVVLALLCAAVACRERGRPDPNVRMAISHDRTEEAPSAGQGPGGEGAAPTRLEVPSEVAQAWSGIRLNWKDKTNGQTGAVEVPMSEGVPLPDPSLVVRADVFLPAFTMGGGAITSDGVAPENPAARITVFEKGKEIFAGWIFTRFPDVHPFTHPRFELRLEGGVPRSSQ